jgi:diadenosine tetraphosphate (Ap4A) HIT family hydrolase
MQKDDCIFCKIVKWEIPSQKIWENDEFMAFLDLSPNCKWQSLIIPKNHYDSDLFEVSDEEFYWRYLKAASEVANMLKNKLWVVRVGMIMEWMGVNHLHIKLYPMYGLNKEWEPSESRREVFFEKYPWYLTTEMWRARSQEELAEVAQQIKG